MKIICVVLVSATLCGATVSLSGTPIWQSDSPTGYATGGAWADINNDANHLLDLVVSTGNDIAANHNLVYYNNGVTLATTPGWQSSDIDFHGHCDVADYNHDGYLDVAVAGFGVYSPYTPSPDRVYKNTGNSSGLPTNATWVSSNKDYTFGIAWGDYDCDGDLDLATASSYDYLSYQDQFKIYQNNSGTLSAKPVWWSSSTYYAMDVEFADINRDGRLDLVAACSGLTEHNLVFLNKGAGYNQTPDWQSADSGRTIQIAVGDYDADGWLDLAAADNAQLGGESMVKVYHNNNGQLENNPSWHSDLDLDRENYSCVAWADCDQDGYPELASGGWWEPAVVFENSHGNLNPTPVWSWNTTPPGSLVCESVLWGDMNGNSRVDVTDESHTANGTAKCFYANHHPLERITSVKENDLVISPLLYCWHPLGGWISFATAPLAGNTVKISYVYSYAPDLAVINWQDNNHNYVFANLGNIGVNLTRFDASPARNGGALVRWACEDDSTVTGYRLYRREAGDAGKKWVTVNYKPITGKSPFSFHDADAADPIVWQYALEAIYDDGVTQQFGPIMVDLSGINISVTLATPAPNPARTLANLRYSCAEGGGRMEIYDLAGRLVRRWELAPTTGESLLVWDLRDNAGQKVATGVYQVRLNSGGMARTRRVVVSR